jgi:N-acetylglutamate synthase-like GNAT family acetyltransferase
MEIRKYNKKDNEQVKQLINKTLWEIFDSKPSKLEDLNDMGKNFEIFLVAEHQNKIIGTIALKRKGIIKRMYIYKKYRNKGLAKKLYNKIEIFAKKKKIKKLRLSTTPQMKYAINFYTKNGFKKIKENKKTNQVFFEKKL